MQGRNDIYTWLEKTILSTLITDQMIPHEIIDHIKFHQQRVGDGTKDTSTIASCALYNCSEYQMADETSAVILGSFDKYGRFYFQVGISQSQSNYSAVLSQLKANAWIDDYTEAVLV